MKIWKWRIENSSIILQMYLLPFYFLMYMILFFDPIKSGVISEIEFNQTVKYKTLQEVYKSLGEPTELSVRDNLIILDYYDFVYPKTRKVRYLFARLIFFKGKNQILMPQNIHFKK